MAEDERRVPSGVKFSDLKKKFDSELNFETETGIEYYAGYEAIVFCDDEIIYEGYFGETDREAHIACDEDSVFEWGSISKTMTWVSAMQLWEQGRLALDADIRDYLPDGFLQHLSYDEPITMMDLMDHTGGWCETTYSFSTPDRTKLRSLAETLQATEPAQVNPPGEVISYSNWGAALAAYVIECITGEDYADYVRENIFDKLGMEHTSIAADFSDNEWVRSQRGKLCSYRFTAPIPKYKSEGKRYHTSSSIRAARQRARSATSRPTRRLSSAMTLPSSSTGRHRRKCLKVRSSTAAPISRCQAAASGAMNTRSAPSVTTAQQSPAIPICCSTADQRSDL